MTVSLRRFPDWITYEGIVAVVRELGDDYMIAWDLGGNEVGMFGGDAAVVASLWDGIADEETVQVKMWESTETKTLHLRAFPRSAWKDDVVPRILDAGLEVKLIEGMVARAVEGSSPS